MYGESPEMMWARMTGYGTEYPQPPGLINVAAIDFDKCLHDNITESSYVPQYGHRFDLQGHVFDLIRGCNHLISFSNRQTCYVDTKNSKGKTQHPRSDTKYSSFHVFDYIEKNFHHYAPHRKISLDRYLLGDTASGNPKGSTWQNTLVYYKQDPTLTQLTENKHFVDDLNGRKYSDYKLDLLYVQTHRFAKRYPEKKIEFHVADDRRDILSTLKQVFERYPHLLPHNVCVYLHFYDHGQNDKEERVKKRSITIISEIQGRGKINHSAEMLPLALNENLRVEQDRLEWTKWNTVNSEYATLHKINPVPIINQFHNISTHWFRGYFNTRAFV